MAFGDYRDGPRFEDRCPRHVDARISEESTSKSDLIASLMAKLDDPHRYGEITPNEIAEVYKSEIIGDETIGFLQDFTSAPRGSYSSETPLSDRIIALVKDRPLLGEKLPEAIRALANERQGSFRVIEKILKHTEDMPHLRAQLTAQDILDACWSANVSCERILGMALSNPDWKNEIATRLHINDGMLVIYDPSAPAPRYRAPRGADAPAICSYFDAAAGNSANAPWVRQQASDVSSGLRAKCAPG